MSKIFIRDFADEYLAKIFCHMKIFDPLVFLVIYKPINNLIFKSVIVLKNI